MSHPTLQLRPLRTAGFAGSVEPASASPVAERSYPGRNLPDRALAHARPQSSSPRLQGHSGPVTHGVSFAPSGGHSGVDSGHSALSANAHKTKKSLPSKQHKVSMHRKTPSHSVRININNATEDAAARSHAHARAQSTSRYVHHTHAESRSHLPHSPVPRFDDDFEGASRKRSKRPRQLLAALRSTPRAVRYLLLACLALVLYLAVLRYRTGPTGRPGPARKADDAPYAAASAKLAALASAGVQADVPVVDRVTVEKLRLLEIHLGPGARDPDQERKNAGDAGELASEEASDLLNEHSHAVHKIPSILKDPPRRQDIVSAAVADRHICARIRGRPAHYPTDTCEFLFPAWLGEQETKAQAHLYQLGLLARALNRTLVLPNVARSRLSACGAYPFAFYYDVDALARLGIPTVTQAEFNQWAVTRDVASTAQLISVVTPAGGERAGGLEIYSSLDAGTVPTKPSRGLCLKEPRTKLSFDLFSPVNIVPPENYHRSEKNALKFGESMVKTLRSADVMGRTVRASRADSSDTDADEPPNRAKLVKANAPGATASGTDPVPQTLVFNYELRYSIFTPELLAKLDADAAVGAARVAPFEHFAYAPGWTELAATVARRLAPFVAIHWRTETLAPDHLVPCARALVAKLRHLKQHVYPDLTTVYLATDFPFEDLDPAAVGLQTGSALRALLGGGGGVPHSGTFAKAATPQHTQAMGEFLRRFDRELSPFLSLTTLAHEQIREPFFYPESIALPDDLSPPPGWVVEDGKAVYRGGFDGELGERGADSRGDEQRKRDLDTRDTHDEAPPPATLDPQRWGIDNGRIRPLVRLEALDAGLIGIVDKAVAMQANVFLVGQADNAEKTVLDSAPELLPGGIVGYGACAKVSSFTRQIITERQRAVEAGENSNLSNVVDFWAMQEKFVD